MTFVPLNLIHIIMCMIIYFQNNDLQYRIKQMQWRRKRRAVESEEEGKVEGLTFRFRSIKISLGDEVIYYRRRLDISKKTT